MLASSACRGHRLPDARKFIARVDSSGDGTIDLEEFERAFEFVPLASLQAGERAGRPLGAPECGGGDHQVRDDTGTGTKNMADGDGGGIGGVAARLVVAPPSVCASRSRREMRMASDFSVSCVASWQQRDGVASGPAAERPAYVFPTGAITCTSYVNLLQLTPADDEIDAMEPVIAAAPRRGGPHRTNSPRRTRSRWCALG